jgi:hypothetical protein
MNKNLIETVESLGGTALMGGILVQFSDTTFAEALKKIYEAGVEAEREACAELCEMLDVANPKGKSWDEGTIDCANAIRARGQA